MEYIIVSWQPPTCCVHFLENASLKVVPGRQTSPPFMCFYFLARITMSSLCPMHHGVINWLFYPGNWSQVLSRR